MNYECRKCHNTKISDNPESHNFICPDCRDDIETTPEPFGPQTEYKTCFKCGRNSHKDLGQQVDAEWLCNDCVRILESEAPVTTCSQCSSIVAGDGPYVVEGYPLCEACYTKRKENVGGLKFDQDKLRVDLISIPAEDGMAAILTIGTKKYNDRNWEVGLDYNRVYRAARHHLTKWFNGEELDPDSGLSHLDHCACNIMFLQYFTKDPERYKEFDNRPNTETSDEGQDTSSS